jgi:hypothetical protein
MKTIYLIIIISFLLMSISYGRGPNPSPAILNANNKGEMRARQDIQEGKNRILYYGKPWSEGKPLIDDESGLPITIMEGCDITPEFAAETEAYNKVMRENAKKNRDLLSIALLPAKAKNADDWGPAYVAGMENGPASIATSTAFGKAAKFMSQQPFAKEFAKMPCAGSAVVVEFALLSDITGRTRGVVKVNEKSGKCSWLGIKKY